LNLLHVSINDFFKIKILRKQKKIIFTSILSIELDDVGGSQLNSSRAFLNVAFILSPHDYGNILNEILIYV
jgi:hypothetical protein